jgi:formylglycine-generating enzyme required for sulfatase activity
VIDSSSLDPNFLPAPKFLGGQKHKVCQLKAYLATSCPTDPQGEVMFTFTHQKEFRSKLYLKTLPVRLSTLLILVLLLASCAPMPVVTGRPQSTDTPVPPPTPGIGSTQVSPKDNMTMVFIPAGEFVMGGENDDPSSFPVHTVYLDAFWIDQTEVTNEMFAKFVESTGYLTDAEKTGSSNDFRTENQTVIWEKVKGLAWNHPDGENSSISAIQDHPVVHVSWNDANEYCTWAGRRLPTEAEWEKAASWNDLTGEKYIYPWGNRFDEILLNFCDKNCAYDFATKHLDDGHAGTSPVGSFPGGASPYGALDMSGNVMEWMADWHSADYYQTSPASNPLGPDSGHQRVSRGGAWATNDYYVSSARRFAWDHPFQHRALGFRCALGTSP